MSIDNELVLLDAAKKIRNKYIGLYSKQKPMHFFDIQSEIDFQLWKFARRFQSNDIEQFKKGAVYIAHKAFLHVLKQNRPHGYRYSFKDAKRVTLLQEFNNDCADALDSIPLENDYYKEEVDINKYLNKLTDKQKEIVVKHILYDEPIVNVAEDLKVDQRTVTKTLAKSIKKMHPDYQGIRRNKTSQYKGVRKASKMSYKNKDGLTLYYEPKRPWAAQAYINGKSKNLGTYHTEEEAAEAVRNYERTNQATVAY